MFDYSAKDRILLHLKHYQRYRDESRVPYEVCQPGIADALGVSRPYLSKEIRKLTGDGEGVLKEEVRRVKGVKRKRKVYFLSREGIREEKVVRDRLENQEITLKTDNSTKKIKLGDVADYIKGKEPILTSLRRMDDNGVLDISKDVKEEEDLFVGRKKELEELKKKFNAVQTTGASVVYISGEAGIGKTRLVSEFKSKVLKEGVEFLSGRCYFESSDPYLPFKKAFQTLMDADKLDENTSHMSLVSPAGPKIHDKKMFDAQRKATFFETTKVVEGIANKDRLIIFLDDIHWIDNASLQLLHYMAHNLRKSPVLFICTYRPEDAEKHDLFNDVKQRMSRERLHEEIELDPLDWEKTKNIVQNTLSVEDIPVDFVDIVHDMSQGNPLFIKEFTKNLISEGIVDPRTNKYPKSRSEIKLPKIINSIIDRRLYILEDKTKKVLQIGSVIGEEVPFELLKRSSGMDELDLLDQIDILLGTKLWTEDPLEEHFKFSHALFQKVAYDEMAEIKKKKLHSMVAENIVDIYEDGLEGWYSDLAYHYHRAEKMEKAVEYYLSAAEYAESVYAHEDAIEMYERVMDIAEDMEEEDVEEVEVLERLSDTNKILGDYTRCRRYLERAMVKTTKPEDQQRMYRKISETYEKQGDFDKTLHFVEKGLALVDDVNPERCKLLEVKGWVRMQLGEQERAEEIFKEEMKMAERMDSDRILSDALHNLGTIEIRTGDYDAASEYLNDSIEIKERIDYKRGLAKSLNNLGIIHLYMGDLDSALEAYTRSLKIEEEIGEKDYIAGLLANLGNLYYLKADLDKAKDNYQRSYEMFEKIGDKRGLVLTMNNLGLISQIRGDLEGAMEKHQRSYEVSKNIGDKQISALSITSTGNVYALRGDFDKAISLHEEAYDMFESMGDKKGAATVQAHLGEVYLEMRELERSIDCFEKALTTYNELREKIEIINVISLLAEALVYSKRLDEAADKAEEALEMSLELNTPFGEISSRYAYGIVLRETGDTQEALDEFQEALRLAEKENKVLDKSKTIYQSALLHKERGDLESAEKYAQEAKDLFEDIGMKTYSERCKELLASL
ncbi:MAG: tetratricopeptide repeat protein [Thermoplasmata archaeon]